MTTFSPSDRSRIVDALNLYEELNRPNSVLATLMTNRETNDTTYSVDRVGQIIEALDKIDQLNDSIEEESGNTGITRYRAEDDIEIAYSSGGSATQPSKQKKQAQIGNIRRWLDPDNRLEAYSLSGRVIRTL